MDDARLFNSEMDAMTAETTNPMFGPNKFKLGLFRMNCEGGLAITKAAHRWRADWDDVLAVSKLADDAGLDLILPLARWKGYGGSIDNAAHSFEVLTQGAALAAATHRIAIFVTVHVPLVHPVFAAKAVATIDHVSHGRVGLNMVCGWNKQEFDMFGADLIAHDDRDEQGLEWYEVFSRLMAGERFDYDGRFYRIRDAYSKPTSIQQPRPVTLSAAGSPVGRAFAAKTSDFLFAVPNGIDHARDLVSEIRTNAAEAKRHAEIFGIAHVVCRETQQEAEEFYHHYAVEFADNEAIDNWLGAKLATSDSLPKEILAERKRIAGGHGSVPLVGTPERVAEEIIGLHDAGLGGTTVSFFDFKDELPLFLDRVLPILEQAGIREPARVGP